jgi:hypothetical protein
MNSFLCQLTKDLIQILTVQSQIFLREHVFILAQLLFATLAKDF